MNKIRTATALTGFLLASLTSHQSPQFTTAAADLLAPPQTHPATPHTAWQPTAWQPTAWQHWGEPLLDPKKFPYSVVFVGENLQNIAQNDVTTAIQRAIDTWNHITCAPKTLQFAGVRSHVSDLSDHEIPIFIPPVDYWRDQQNLIASTNMNPPAIALNTAHFTWALQPAPFQYLAPNSSSTPTDPLIVDLQSVLTHELGHVLGLWHTQDDATAVMTAKYLPDASQRTLSADDKFALCHLFPLSKTPAETPNRTTAECTRDHDCPTGTCITDGTFHVCQKHHANPGDFCALDLLHCPHGCTIDSPSTGTGYCTAPCQLDTDCPTSFQCTTTQNQPTCQLLRPDTPQQNNPPTSCSTLPNRPTKPGVFTPLLSIFAIFASLSARNHRKRKKSAPTS